MDPIVVAVATAVIAALLLATIRSKDSDVWEVTAEWVGVAIFAVLTAGHAWWAISALLLLATAVIDTKRAIQQKTEPHPDPTPIAH